MSVGTVRRYTIDRGSINNSTYISRQVVVSTVQHMTGYLIGRKVFQIKRYIHTCEEGTNRQSVRTTVYE